MQASHALYRRHHIEHAIQQMMWVSGRPYRSPEDIRADIKRLLDFDRKPRTRKPQSAWNESAYAFFDEPPPGTGFQIDYSPQNAFSILIGYQLLIAGLPQADVVRRLRFARGELHHEFNRIMALGLQPRRAYDVEAGAMTYKVTRLSFFVTAAAATGRPAEADYRPDDPHGIICPNLKSYLRLTLYFSQTCTAFISFELVNSAYQLTHWLARAPDRKRGPKG